MSRQNILGIIPARMASTRFPGKPLALIAGKPMIQRVYERACLANSLQQVVIATDTQEIATVAESFGAKAVMTSANHPSGLDRVLEVAEKFSSYSYYLNIQGDEPLIAPATIDAVAALFRNPACEVATAAVAFRNRGDVQDPNQVKVVLGVGNRALYFSRSPIPYFRNQNSGIEPLKHLGLYGYSAAALKKIKQLPQHPLELAESLEQLRFLAHGMYIGVAIVQEESIGVDLPSDIEKVENFLRVNAQ